jgi:hypothetical protein
MELRKTSDETNRLVTINYERCGTGTFAPLDLIALSAHFGAEGKEPRLI